MSIAPWIDALTQKVREGGRTVNVHALIATGVNADGKREILGLDIASSEDGAGWLAFLRGLAARGLSGVQLVTSDCHHGLRDAIAAVLPGASWQRCRAHYSRNLATKVPKSAQPWVSTLVRTIFEQSDAASVRAQHAQVVTALEAKFPAAASADAGGVGDDRCHTRAVRANQRRLAILIDLHVGRQVKGDLLVGRRNRPLMRLQRRGLPTAPHSLVDDGVPLDHHRDRLASHVGMGLENGLEPGYVAGWTFRFPPTDVIHEDDSRA